MPPWGLLLIWEQQWFWAGVACPFSPLLQSIQWVGGRGMHRGLEEGDISVPFFHLPRPQHTHVLSPTWSHCCLTSNSGQIVGASLSFLGAAPLKLESVLKSTSPQLDTLVSVSGCNGRKLQICKRKLLTDCLFLAWLLTSYPAFPGWIRGLTIIDQSGKALCLQARSTFSFKVFIPLAYSVPLSCMASQGHTGNICPNDSPLRQSIKSRKAHSMLTWDITGATGIFEILSIFGSTYLEFLPLNSLWDYPWCHNILGFSLQSFPPISPKTHKNSYWLPIM